jgi:hypothetical protein
MGGLSSKSDASRSALAAARPSDANLLGGSETGVGDNALGAGAAAASDEDGAGRRFSASGASVGLGAAREPVSRCFPDAILGSGPRMDDRPRGRRAATIGNHWKFGFGRKSCESRALGEIVELGGSGG